MSAVARRYAKAVFALAKELQKIESVGAELGAAAHLLGAPALAEVISSPLLSTTRRNAILDAVRQQLSLSPTAANFLSVLGDHLRLAQMDAIVEQYQRLEDRALGRIRLLIRTAAPLADDRQAEIAAVFEGQLGKTVISRVETDPTLLGGIVVEAEGKVYDGSVRTQLERLSREIARSDIHA